ncbi:MAG: NAD(P)H-hydrate dehydratase [Bilophila sp.]
MRAHATVTFEAAKPGLILPEASPFVGQLHIRPIGIPRLVRESYPASYQSIDRDLAALLPMPTPHWHKGSAGTVLIIGGTDGLTGAPHLAARAALRSGAGLVRVAAPAGLCKDIKAHCPDIMTQPLGDAGTTHWSPALLKELLPALAQSDAVVIGPGIGREPDTIAFVLAFLAQTRPATVIDADALYALATAPHCLQALKKTDILTPHPGEAARLLEGGTATQGEVCGTAQIQADRFAALEALRALSPAVWILKGAGTLVGSPEHPVSVCPHAVPNLAVGGSGDVLAGCLGTLLAQSPPDSHLVACLGVLLHAEAGRLLAHTFPVRGNTASDIADALPKARAELVQTSD